MAFVTSATSISSTKSNGDTPSSKAELISFRFNNDSAIIDDGDGVCKIMGNVNLGILYRWW